MGCLLPLIGLFCPRLLMIFICCLTTWFSRAYETTLWPLLGFFFMPYTTLAYMASMLNNDHAVTGWWVVLVVFAVITDLTASTDSAARRETYQQNFRTMIHR